MNLDILLVYAVVAFFYIISPGPAIFLSISNAMSADMKAVATSSLGNITGLLLLSIVSILGLGTLLSASAELFMAVKVIGAAYLIYLGVRQFRHSKSLHLGNPRRGAKQQRGFISYYKEGFFLAATNPKPILFFTALFPQFLNLDTPILPQFLILTAVFMAFSFMVLCTYGVLSKSAKGWLGDPDRMVWFHRITGGLFIAMGIGLLQLRSTQN